MAYNLATNSQKGKMIEVFGQFEHVTNLLTDEWLNFPSEGDAFMKDYPLENESFCDFAAKVREWVKTSIADLQKDDEKPLSFKEFVEGRTTYIPEQYEEIYGAGTILMEDHNRIGLVYTYTGGLHILAIRDGKFWVGIENADYAGYDLNELERKLYEFYLADFKPVEQKESFVIHSKNLTTFYLSSIDSLFISDNNQSDGELLEGVPKTEDWSGMLKGISEQDVKLVWDTIKFDLSETQDDESLAEEA